MDAHIHYGYERISGCVRMQDMCTIGTVSADVRRVPAALYLPVALHVGQLAAPHWQYGFTLRMFGGLTRLTFVTKVSRFQR